MSDFNLISLSFNRVELYNTDTREHQVVSVDRTFNELFFTIAVNTTLPEDFDLPLEEPAEDISLQLKEHFATVLVRGEYYHSGALGFGDALENSADFQKLIEILKGIAKEEGLWKTK